MKGDPYHLHKVVIPVKENVPFYNALGASTGTPIPSDTITYNTNSSYGGSTAATGGIKIDATVTDGTSSIVLSTGTLDGVTITAADFGAATLKVYDTSESEMKTIILNKYTWTPGTLTLDTTGAIGTFTFNTGDEVLLLMASETAAGYDEDQGALLNIRQNPEWAKYTDPESLVAAVDLADSDATWKELGSEIPCGGYKTLNFWVVFTVNDSSGCKLRVLSKHTSAGSDEYILETVGQYEKVIGDADKKILYSFNVEGIPFVQLQGYATDVIVTAGAKATVTIDITKEF